MKSPTHFTSSPQINEPIKSMYQESSEWLNWIRSCRATLISLYHVLHEKEKKNPFPSEHLALLDKEIIALTSEQLDLAEKMAGKHELHLRWVFGQTTSTVSTSCEALHLQLFHHMEHVRVVFAEFLHKVNDLVEQDSFSAA